MTEKRLETLVTQGLMEADTARAIEQAIEEADFDAEGIPPEVEADRAEARRLARELTPESIAAMPVFDAADYLTDEASIAAFVAEMESPEAVAGLSDEERAKALAGAQSVVARARKRLGIA